MKNTFLTLLFFISTLTSFGQSLFFDNLNSTTWSSSGEISELTLKSNKEIPLTKRTLLQDTKNEVLSVWTFRDSVLIIVKYVCKTKANSLIAKYKYEINDKGILKIILQDNTELNYKVGVDSTGSHAVLIRTK